MTSSDVRDVLNLPDGAAGGPRPSKKAKITAPRPNLKGLAREVHNLGGDNPIAIVPEVTQFKKRRFVSRKPAARWELRQFANSGRKDESLVLRHWRRVEEGKQSSSAAGDGNVPETEDVEDSLYAKYNVQVSVPQYNEDQYHQVLENPDWTKEETDYLMELVRDFDIRWPLIWDRYEWTTRSRSMEDLKARYYEVASRMMAVQKPVQYMTQPEFALHELMAHFNPQQEKLRKDFALNSFGRSREEAREEESLLLEIKRILARSDRFNEERRELYNRLDYPHAEQDINTFKSSAGLQTLLQNLMTADKSKKRKSIMGAEVPTPSGQPTPQQAAPENGRRDSAAASSGPRESGASTAASSAHKKSQSQSQQQIQQQQAQQQQQQQQSQQQQLQERKKLTEHEEIIYGVTHHDRLGSGPTFRTEKINKLFSHKSNQQQLRITNTLNELDVPAKLAMPTAATTHAFEQLLASVNSLLDARKITDKIDAEIKLELAKKAEREKALDESAEADEPSKDNDEDGAAAQPEDDEKEQDEDAAPSDEATAQPSVEQDDDNADEGKDGGVTTRKRSASVLSSVSDKSLKRQKK
ncbi:SANT/Myb-like domain of DAMP1 domain-containing protein [Trichoderma breve]|uniref:SWR1-complex protein 4 n=1 Tax=Trichoderma breve TaxID=2034170 RepID=A0A9W9EBY3_9HYPO|nr:SANT/Myb-like domain of DAMP1 domain-containing protein [Trichoderma breve]KAJ4863782.1 SANT/Myb-like domain of DAMP1 domain-containing protein [Trichoderma breve]